MEEEKIGLGKIVPEKKETLCLCDNALGLPRGSVRAIIAIAVVVPCMIAGLVDVKMPIEITTLMATICGYYFGKGK
jgi:hypothetical protein